MSGCVYKCVRVWTQEAPLLSYTHAFDINGVSF
jgi:hypothetical protein